MMSVKMIKMDRKSNIIPLCGVILVLLYKGSLTVASSEAKRLYDDLLKRKGYNRLIRPVSNKSDTLVVRIGLRLTQILDIVSVFIIH